MAKTKLSEYDSTPGNNTDVAAINIAEGCAPSNINNAIRALMGHLKDFVAGSADTLPVTAGGTGAATLAANNVLLGNDTSALQVVAPGASGTALISDGSTWASGPSVPVGSLFMWPTATAPDGYLICDGSAVSRTGNYAALFGVIGTTFGDGDGSTTFNLPDYQDRMPIGAGSTYSANSTGGSKDAIVVEHNHTVNDPTHRHFVEARGLGGFATTPNYIMADVNGPSGPYGQYSNYASTGISLSSAGSSGTNANLPPYIGIYFIIRAQ